jgi:hypothetical protein
VPVVLRTRSPRAAAVSSGGRQSPLLDCSLVKRRFPRRGWGTNAATVAGHSLPGMDKAHRWRAIAKSLAEALEDGDEARATRALVIYRQVAWREDVDEVRTTDPPDATGRHWRAEVRLDYWDNAAAHHAAAHDVIVSGGEQSDETVVTCTWVTADVGIGAAMFELTERMRAVFDIHMVDFGSVELLAG